MALSPAYAVTPNCGSALLTTLDASYTAPAIASTLITAGASGTKINRIYVKSVATNVAGKVLLFLHDGTTYHLFDEIPLTAVTISGTVSGFAAERAYTDLVLKTGWSLRASLSVTQTGIKVSAIGADL